MLFMDTFAHIRPYQDNEVQVVLQRLLKEPELRDALVRFRFANCPKWLRRPLAWGLSFHLKRRVAGIRTVRDFQRQLEPFIQHMIETSTAGLTVKGLEQLDLSQPCLFISNHRDIALDPAFVSWALHLKGQDTVRIAIGDNLLTKSWVSDLMRLNKSFIVKRSASSKKEKLQVSKELSAYIYHSLVAENAHIWIAQREGRAKDGVDKTNPAIVSMLMLNKPKEQDFAAYLAQLRIVPVAIGYEYDPCDLAKANELHQQALTGQYEKQDHEDVASISRGITGYKGKVVLCFGQVIQGDAFASARQVADEIDRQIHTLYPDMITTRLAAEKLGMQPCAIDNGVSRNMLEQERNRFEQRLNSVPDDVRQRVLAMYAAPLLPRSPSLPE
ncbi:1-acyl-sn-glycerol-3-phosphate acyltransferase [Bowmanella denitrificans]|uniref:1-acyl-sn-glycerol-3-phosphate acyltransferase n=1 Tax=Bowmanella denitrificans TaxID=366582 RepID=A0ABP3HAJ8_9ALTE